MTPDQLAATKQIPQLTGTDDLLHSDTASDPALGIGIGLNIFSATDPLCNPDEIFHVFGPCSHSQGWWDWFALAPITCL